MGWVWACFGRSVCWAGFGHASGGLRTRRAAAFVGRFGICTNNGADTTPWELLGPILKSFLGPRSSSSERLKQFCIFQVARAPQVQNGTCALAPLCSCDRSGIGSPARAGNKQPAGGRGRTYT
eukprot:15440297-Alexandrium_andersonii.AAC.1